MACNLLKKKKKVRDTEFFLFINCANEFESSVINTLRLHFGYFKFMKDNQSKCLKGQCNVLIISGVSFIRVCSVSV